MSRCILDTSYKNLLYPSMVTCRHIPVERTLRATDSYPIGVTEAEIVRHRKYIH